MSDFAGYAVAVTIHTHVFDDQFLSAWNTGQFAHSVSGSFGQLPGTTGGVNLFFQPPQVICSDTNEVQAILRLSGWGTLSVRLTTPGLFEKRSVQWQADILITPTVFLSNFIILPNGQAKTGAFVILSAAAKDYRLTDWEFDVFSGTPFPSGAEDFFNGDIFKADLLTFLQNTLGDIKVPIMDFSSLGPFSGSAFSNIALKVVGTGLLLGIDVDLGAGMFSTSGDFTQLKDVAGTNDIQVVVNPDAILPLMPTLRQEVQQQIPSGATLDTFFITCEEGQFRVKGSASDSDGTANFSLAAVPALSTGIAGGIFPITQKKTITIPSRSWPALSFFPTDVSVSVDPHESTLEEVLNVVADVLTVGIAELFKQLMIWEIEGDIEVQVQGSDLNPDGTTPLVQRSGSPPTRFAIQDFQIHTFGLYIGITATLETPAARLTGIKSIASNYVSQSLFYAVTLPFDALQDDPFLRVRWTVVDVDSGATLVNSDDVAFNRLSFQFIPSSVGPGSTRFAVICRVYRALGPFITDLFNDTIRMTVGPALPHNAYIRWTYQVKNPQFRLAGSTDPQWSFIGQSTIQRHSKIHRLDHPCRNANHRSRFTPDQQFWETLPFPVADINTHRDSLCDYCFFGGPGSTIASL